MMKKFEQEEKRGCYNTPLAVLWSIPSAMMSLRPGDWGRWSASFAPSEHLTAGPAWPDDREPNQRQGILMSKYKTFW
jgi:hypothetical protein